MAETTLVPVGDNVKQRFLSGARRHGVLSSDQMRQVAGWPIQVACRLTPEGDIFAATSGPTMRLVLENAHLTFGWNEQRRHVSESRALNEDKRVELAVLVMCTELNMDTCEDVVASPRWQSLAGFPDDQPDPPANDLDMYLMDALGWSGFAGLVAGE